MEKAASTAAATGPRTTEQRLATLEEELADAKKEAKKWADKVGEAIEKKDEELKKDYKGERAYWEGKVEKIKEEMREKEREQREREKEREEREREKEREEREREKEREEREERLKNKEFEFKKYELQVQNTKRARIVNEVLGSTTHTKSWRLVVEQKRLSELPLPAEAHLKDEYLTRRRSKGMSEEVIGERFNFVQKQLNTIFANDFKKEAELQPVAIQVAHELAADLEEILVMDTHANTYLSGHKPDGSTTFTTHKYLTALTVLGTMEFKVVGFDSDHFGEALLWMRLTLEAQPWRKFTKCLIMNGKQLNILRMVRVPGTSIHRQATVSIYAMPVHLNTPLAVFMLDDFLHGSNDTTPSNIPSKFQNPVTGSFDVECLYSLHEVNVLAATSQGTVYHVLTQEREEKVLKLCSYESYTAEKEALRQLRHQPTCLQLMGFDDTIPALLLPYKGLSLERSDCTLTRPILVQLLKQLEAIHGSSILHRDIRASNMVANTADATIIDFGCAVRCSNDAHFDTYCGSPLYSAQQHIKTLADNVTENVLEGKRDFALAGRQVFMTFSRRTDLESFVKTWITVLLSRNAKEELVFLHHQCRDLLVGGTCGFNPFADLYSLWERILSESSHWQQAIQAARSLQYSAIAQLIQDFPLIFPL